MITMPEIAEFVANHYRVPVDSIKGRNRNYEVLMKKRIALLLIREYCRKITLQEMAGFFNLDFSTIGYGLKASRRWLQRRGFPFRDMYLEIKTEFETNYLINNTPQNGKNDNYWVHPGH